MSLLRGGIITTWHLVDGSSDKLEKAWKDAKLPRELLPRPSLDESLGRAVNACLSDYIFAWFRKDSKEWVVLVDDVDADTFRPILRLRIKNYKPNVFAKDPESKTARKLSDRICKEFEHQRDRLAAEELSKTVVNLAVVIAHAVPLDERVYFIPETHVDVWRKLADALRKVGDHTFHEIVVPRTPGADMAIGDAVVRQTEMAVAEIDREVDAANSKIGLQSKTHRVAEIEEQIGIYESYFTDPSVREAVERLRARLARAFLVAENKDA